MRVLDLLSLFLAACMPIHLSYAAKTLGFTALQSHGPLSLFFVFCFVSEE